MNNADNPALIKLQEIARLIRELNFGRCAFLSIFGEEKENINWIAESLHSPIHRTVYAKNGSTPPHAIETVKFETRRDHNSLYVNVCITDNSVTEEELKLAENQSKWEIQGSYTVK